MKKENPATECEKLARAFDELKREIFKTWFGKFMWWILERLSQATNWIRLKIKKGG